MQRCCLSLYKQMHAPVPRTRGRAGRVVCLERLLSACAIARTCLLHAVVSLALLGSSGKRGGNLFLVGVRGQVFLREQQLYPRKQLEQHQATGDAEGPLKEAGFKGHPLCK